MVWPASYRNRTPVGSSNILARSLAQNTAQYFGAGDRKGRIEAGFDADFAVIDLDRRVKLGHSRMRGGSDNSIWEGKEARGLPVMTILRGQVVCENGEITAEKARGAYLPPAKAGGG